LKVYIGGTHQVVLQSVDFPQPLSPTMLRISPFFSFREIPVCIAAGLAVSLCCKNGFLQG